MKPPCGRCRTPLESAGRPLHDDGWRGDLRVTDTVGTEADAAKCGACFIGGGVASLVRATLLLRDIEIPGENVHVLGRRQVSDGAFDGRGTPEEGYALPGGRIFNSLAYECTWNLFRPVPSPKDPGTTIKGEVDEFSEKHETYAEARLVGADQGVLDIFSYGFETQHCLSLFRLPPTPEERLGEARIEEWFDETSLDIMFWYL